jgi:SAM-dependent methyltransferase
MIALHNKLEWYRWAVQEPETHAVLLGTIYDRLRSGRQPSILREDFSGTSADSVAWVALRRGRRAIAVDTDGETLAWARQRAGRLIGPRASEITFLQADVCRIEPPEIETADIISALNYSVFYLRESGALNSWLRRAHLGLAANGLLVFNIFGGPASVRVGTTCHRVIPRPRLSAESPVSEFDYSWEVQSYDPATRDLDCRIHFTVPDELEPGTTREIRNAFRYPWRHWSVDELISACTQAGYANTQLWRHTFDPSLGSEGVFLGPVAQDSLCGLESWNAYVVACR